jgi:preprotein translocase subunit SecG
VHKLILWATAFINVVSVLAMIGAILLHSGRGGGLSDMFGGASGAALGSTSAERNLNRITMVLALVWIFTIVALGLLMD